MKIYFEKIHKFFTKETGKGVYMEGVTQNKGYQVESLPNTSLVYNTIKKDLDILR